MFWQGLILWYDNYGLWPWQAKPRPIIQILHRKGEKKNWTELSLLGQEPTFKEGVAKMLYGKKKKKKYKVNLPACPGPQ